MLVEIVMTDTDKSRFVATALGLPGSIGVHTPWEPPDLTTPAGADLLLRTLLARDGRVTLELAHFATTSPIEIICWVNLEGIEGATASSTDWKPALLDAAYRLLKADDRKTMDDVSANATAGSVICDGCNVRKGWEHRCHSGLQFGESFARIMIRGEAHEDTICECSECKAVGRSIPTRHRPQR